MLENIDREYRTDSNGPRIWRTASLIYLIFFSGCTALLNKPWFGLTVGINLN